LQRVVDQGLTRKFDVTLFGEEPRPAYDRVALSSLFDGLSPEDLSLVPAGFFQQAGIRSHIGDRVVDLDRATKTVRTERGASVRYDKLVLATGSRPFVPPLPGCDLAGCFVYRTVEDVAAIREWAAGARIGAVIGGGLLGLEAARALASLGLETHVVERAPRLLPLQVDEGGGLALRRRIEDLGVKVHTGAETREIVGENGRVRALRWADGTDLELDMIVFSAGIKPKDDLARQANLDVGERGGISVDETCRTSDPDIYAIGECAFASGQIWGLVGPGYAMADVVADHLAGGAKTFTGGDLSTKLKLMGVDVASFGDAFGRTPGARDISFRDLVGNVYKRLVLSDDGRVVLGGMLVGDASAYGALVQMVKNRMPVPPRPEQLILPATDGKAAAMGVDSLPDEAIICSCNNVAKRDICHAIGEKGLTDVAAVKTCTKAGTGCGGCATLVGDLLRLELAKSGIQTPTGICEHFAYTRQELFDLLRVESIQTFGELLQRYGSGGRGCEVCKPAVASMLASMSIGSYVLEGEQASLQDTNDHFLANLQKDGSYSVIPRIPGGEVTPDKLIVLGEVARDFQLYVKITGGQRIDLLGARVEQLPQIWQRLVDAGFESGHAYAKALRTVKSCVGNTWCRYGVGDSVALAIELELRYRGLRAPHKIKAAVSGCARECAEAQGKDFGVIATERGWNLYVCGNGGMRPQHAVLFATDLAKDVLIRYIDRFLMFYIRTAGRLERTASWLNHRAGGIAELRRILIDDELGICAELEAHMAKHIDNYRCEWKSTLEDPERMARFVHFVNASGPDPNLVFLEERGQIRPAKLSEKPDPSEFLLDVEVR
jgi:nitrite reductase (NADH) large subunit